MAWQYGPHREMVIVARADHLGLRGALLRVDSFAVHGHRLIMGREEACGAWKTPSLSSAWKTPSSSVAWRARVMRARCRDYQTQQWTAKDEVAIQVHWLVMGREEACSAWKTSLWSSATTDCQRPRRYPSPLACHAMGRGKRCVTGRRHLRAMYSEVHPGVAKTTEHENKLRNLPACHEERRSLQCMKGIIFKHCIDSHRDSGASISGTLRNVSITGAIFFSFFFTSECLCPSKRPSKIAMSPYPEQLPCDGGRFVYRNLSR